MCCAIRIATKEKEEELGLTLNRRQVLKVSGSSTTNLDFADDFALLSNDNEQAITLLTKVEIECRKSVLNSIQ